MNIVSTTYSQAVSIKNLSCDFLRCNKNSRGFFLSKLKVLKIKTRGIKKNHSLSAIFGNIV